MNRNVFNQHKKYKELEKDGFNFFSSVVRKSKSLITYRNLLLKAVCSGLQDPALVSYKGE